MQPETKWQQEAHMNHPVDRTYMSNYCKDQLNV